MIALAIIYRVFILNLLVIKFNEQVITRALIVNIDALVFKR